MSTISVQLDRQLARTVRFTGWLKNRPWSRPRVIAKLMDGVDFFARGVHYVWRNRKYLSALISLDAEALAAYAQAHGIDPNKAHDDPTIRASIQKVVDEMTARVARVETVKKFTILPRPLSIDQGELTPTLKVKRKVVNEQWASAIDGMYTGDTSE